MVSKSLLNVRQTVALYIIITLDVSFIHKIVEPNEEMSLPQVLSAFITFSASVPHLSEFFKVFFRLTYFVRRLVKAFFAVSLVSKPRSFPIASYPFSSHFYYGMLRSLYHTSMNTFALRLLVQFVIFNPWSVPWNWIVFNQNYFHMQWRNWVRSWAAAF